ncbi:hypothetical protein V2A60_004802 [Cordyceps javanica]
MVNHGRSKGCVTCKQRRVKCDEANPACGPCRRLRLRCGGYDAKPVRRLKFKDQTHKFVVAKSTERRAGSHCASVRTPGLRSLAEPDSAVPFFLGQYASKGRETASARGFFEMLIPTYNAQPAGSPLELAVEATATMVLSLWRHGPKAMPMPRTAYAAAVSSILKALQDDAERRKPATVMAVVALQQYENIAAVYNLRPATRVHQSGAVSLLPYLATDGPSSAGNSIQSFVFHTEIASAIREKRPLCGACSPASVHAGNPSSVLDTIGADVALLQARHKQVVNQSLETTELRSVLTSQIQEARRIENQLLAWEQLVPRHWKPLRLSREQMSSSIPAYQGVCETYASCSIASIWNLWRVQRLILMVIMAESSGKIEAWADRGACELVVQGLVDGICYSVPFYLGDRSQPMLLSDFMDSSTVYPSDTMAHLNHIERSSTTSDHRGHIIAQGPWHVMSPLSRLMELIAERSGKFILPVLRVGQADWIREQFLRVTMLLHISLAHGIENSPGSSASNSQSAQEETKQLLKVVRSGLRFMSGS